jgi:predicted transcriptional regulator
MNESSLKAQLDELATLKQSAMDAAETYKEGVESVAESIGISKTAISKYITARLADKLDKLEEETGDIEKLLGA